MNMSPDGGTYSIVTRQLKHHRTLSFPTTSKMNFLAQINTTVLFLHCSNAAVFLSRVAVTCFSR